MQNKRMNLRLFEEDVNIIDRTGAETLIPTQESNEIIQGTDRHSQPSCQEVVNWQT